jgi:hypothetical protein
MYEGATLSKSSRNIAISATFLWLFDFLLLLPLHLEIVLNCVGVLLREGEGHHLLVELGRDFDRQGRHVDLKMILQKIISIMQKIS